MRKILLTLVCGLWFSCVAAPCHAQALPTGDRLSIIATVFPAYDFAHALVGDLADVRLLLPPGVESHTFEPTPQDVLALQGADLLVYVGGESEHWVKEILASLGEDAPFAMAMMNCVTLKEEQHSASMAHEHLSDVDHGPQMDEHVWTSPRNAKQIVLQMSQELQRLCPSDNMDALIAHNQAEYQVKLDALDATFADIVGKGLRQKIIFGDRFPFRYFADAYGLSYDAAFPGCSEDSEPSAQTLVSLIGEIQAEQIPVVFYIEFSNHKTADILAEETGARTMLMHSCHNVSQAEMDKGVTYLSLMEGNAAALREALN